jgi:lysophospholipase L1-like esterase
MRHVTGRLRLLGAALAILAASFAASIVARADDGFGRNYLALGDSVAFGSNPLLDAHNARNFIGYPTPVAEALDVRLDDPACPGETSSHFISLAGADLNCGTYRQSFPLHVTYSTSQLDYADAYLRSHADTRLVTIDIGSNDVFALQAKCGGDITCVEQGLPATLGVLSANLTIYGHIRKLDNYRHRLVALTYYSFDYNDRTTTAIIELLNQTISDRTLAWGGIVADGFEEFAAASVLFNGDTCAAGLRIVVQASPLACDIHPSPRGRALLARAVLEALHKHEYDY